MQEIRLHVWKENISRPPQRLPFHSWTLEEYGNHARTAKRCCLVFQRKRCTTTSIYATLLVKARRTAKSSHAIINFICAPDQAALFSSCRRLKPIRETDVDFVGGQKQTSPLRHKPPLRMRAPTLRDKQMEENRTFTRELAARRSSRAASKPVAINQLSYYAICCTHAPAKSLGFDHVKA